MSVAARYRYTVNLHLQRKESFPKEANLMEVFFVFPAVKHENKKPQRPLWTIKAIRDDTTIPTSYPIR